jgi:hypothetical protein
MSLKWSPTWTFVGEHTNPRLRRLRMLRRRISRRSGNNSAVWASSSSKAKPFSIFSNSSPLSRMVRISGAGPSPDGMPAGQDFISRPA